MKDPTLFVLRPGGSVETRSLARHPAGPPLPEDRFQATVAFDAPGEHVLEVLASGKGGPQVVAMRRLFAGVPRPVAPPPELQAAEDATGLEAAATAITALP